ncbi:MAG: transposase, partial [Chlamydiia bacterium]|nr:transposase [Chlamydiia bacterium]
MKKHPVGGRKTVKRKETFFIDEDPCHKKWELLCELFHNPQAKSKDLCIQYGTSLPSYYRLINDYKSYGPWAIISAPSYGKQASIGGETELNIILEKLRNPKWTAQQIVDALELKCTRFVVNRVFETWGLEDTLKPIALNEYVVEEKAIDDVFKPTKSAYQLLPENTLLDTRRINRSFDLVCKKMNTNTYHICDPGPILLAPFLNDFGIIQAFETYGPPRLRGKEMTNLPLLNVMRILGGYERINHLSDNRDRSVAFASGLGLFGTRSKFYDDAIEFKFDNLHKLRCDLVARAFELGIISGKSIGFDFHFKEFFGSGAKEKGIGQGPDKSGQLVPGFRPHIAWDLAENVIITLAYYQGATRSPRILKSFCERDLFIVLDQLLIEEIYMDSEYTKEADFFYLKKTCKNGDIYVCLRQNLQIKKLIKPALDMNVGWEKHNESDERKTIDVALPKTGLKMRIVILRDSSTKENIRCFGTTNLAQLGEDILRKYPHRWTVENGIKDLIRSYFVDEIFGHDPEKVEFEFYCVMTARLVYEHFLKKLGGPHYKKEDGNKTTLSTMRQLLFEKRNCTLRQDSNQNLVLTFLDSGDPVEGEVGELYKKLTKKEKNKVL